MLSRSIGILFVIFAVGSGALLRADEEVPGATTGSVAPIAPNPPKPGGAAMIAAAQDSTPPGSTSANPAAPGGTTPTLPETEVLGERTPSNGPATPGEGGSILDGTIFSKPAGTGL